jgi:hypothetical protein
LVASTASLPSPPSWTLDPQGRGGGARRSRGVRRDGWIPHDLSLPGCRPRTAAVGVDQGRDLRRSRGSLTPGEARRGPRSPAPTRGCPPSLPSTSFLYPLCPSTRQSSDSTSTATATTSCSSSVICPYSPASCAGADERSED